VGVGGGVSVITVAGSRTKAVLNVGAGVCQLCPQSPPQHGCFVRLIIKGDMRDVFSPA